MPAEYLEVNHTLAPLWLVDSEASMAQALDGVLEYQEQELEMVGGAVSGCMALAHAGSLHTWRGLCE